MKGEENTKKKGFAFKASLSQIEEEVKNDDSDEEMALFTRRFNKMFKRATKCLVHPIK